MHKKLQNKSALQPVGIKLDLSMLSVDFARLFLALSMLFFSGVGLAKPGKILSATLASDEMLTAILTASCEPQPCLSALNRMVAVSRFADDPRYSNIRKLVGGIKGRFSGDIEQVVALKPDLVILASFSRPEIISRLQSIKIEKYMMKDLVSIGAIESTIEALGALIDEPAAAAKVLAEMRGALAEVTGPNENTASKKRVLHIYDDGTVSGRNTLFDAIANASGATNAAHDLVNGWQKLSIEALIKLNPDAIVVGGSPNLSRADEIAKLKSIPGVTKLSAWLDGRVIVIPDPELAAVSPHITKAIAKLRAGLKAASIVTEAQHK